MPTTTTTRFDNHYTISSVTQAAPPLQGASERIQVSINQGEPMELGLWEYPFFYRHSGMYEAILLDHLDCWTHQTTVEAFLKIYRQTLPPSPLRVLDVGAGVGLVGEQFHTSGVCEWLAGYDALAEAQQAVHRDRPHIYNHYVWGSLEQCLPQWSHPPFNCLTAVSCVGAGDLDEAQFMDLVELIAPGGWVVFNIREQATPDQLEIVKAVSQVGTVVFQQSFFHRYRVDGAEIRFQTIVVKKHKSEERQ